VGSSWRQAVSFTWEEPPNKEGEAIKPLLGNIQKCCHSPDGGRQLKFDSPPSKSWEMSRNRVVTYFDLLLPLSAAVPSLLSYGGYVFTRHYKRLRRRIVDGPSL